MLVVEFDFEHIGSHRRIEATTQADHAHRRLLPTQLLETCAH
jgi:hypothetical protein